ncbi:hypothetical protein [Aneurinibacillus tyrosinisolvens]|uniref:hypothetical protein n=1 Tax=Aneurinibacillus tyrosinisolvens TaxID=1443435 RepID=UPI00063F14FA|nr:hypothetical protein [Aneurinibacillus tyrosinisolvens]
MKAKGRKSLLWILAAILMFSIISLTINILSDGFNERENHHPSMNSGYEYGQTQVIKEPNSIHEEDPMYGHHDMHEHDEIEGFHVIGSAVSFVFGLVVIGILIRWLRKNRKGRPFNKSIMDTPLSYTTYTVNQNQPDFLDEWEKKQTHQTNKKENE